jgi:hypothetical protein
MEEGAGGTGAAAVAAAAATVSRCGPAATIMGRDDSPVAAASPATRNTLDERRLVRMDVSNLSTFVGARAGTDDITLQMKRKTRG